MPRVTRIIPQKRNPNRRNVYLDGTFSFGCHVNVVAKFLLREGMELTAEEVRAIQCGQVQQECFDKAMEFLSRRAHSRAELSRKLMRGEYGTEVVGAVLDELTRLGYLDDRRFAQVKAMAAAEHRQHGRRRAYVELMKSGVDAQVAREALDEVYGRTDSLAMARELARKQSARLRKLAPEVARRRLVGMLQRRGFEYEAIRPVVEEVLGGAERE